MKERLGNERGTGLRRTTLALIWLTALLVPVFSGCIYVEAEPNRQPYLTYVDAYAGWDSYYGQCYWEFYAWVQDWDGCYDVRTVSVDVVDLAYGDIVATFNLASDGCIDSTTQQFSDTIYEQYAGWADCNYPDYYGYDFYAYDSYGAYDYAGI